MCYQEVANMKSVSYKTHRDYISPTVQRLFAAIEANIITRGVFW